MECDAFLWCLDDLRQNRPCVLTTVLRQDGSAPRGAGATMAVMENGRIAGTVGGGMLEHQAIRRSLACLEEERSVLTEYRLAPGGSLNMVCGGNVTLLCHYVKPEDANAVAALTAIEKAEKRRGGLWLARRITPDGAVSMAAYTDQGPLGERLLSREQEAALGNRQAALWEDEALIFLQPLRMAGRAYVFGGGHVAQRLVPLLHELEFSPVVFEDRPQYAKKELFPQADGIILGSFSAVEESIAIEAEDSVVIMTRGHAHDNLLLTQVLRSPACYIGLMGSRSKVAATQAFLQEQGFSEADIARIHTPVGLAIGAETPAEIAVSVAGEMILCRARRSHSRKLPADG